MQKYISGIKHLVLKICPISIKRDIIYESKGLQQKMKSSRLAPVMALQQQPI